MQSYVDQAHKMIHEKTGLGNDFLGWVDLPKNYNKEEVLELYLNTSYFGEGCFTVKEARRK